MGESMFSSRTMRVVAVAASVALAASACGDDDAAEDTASAPAEETASAPAEETASAPAEETASAPAEETASAPADETASAPGAAEMCGDEPLRIAHVDGFGSNTWRQITAAELRDELSVCSNIQLDYSQADGDLQTYLTAINSFTAQGYDAIITYDDFGSQALDALRSAHDAGIVVVPYISDPGGEVGVDYDGFVAYDFVDEGAQMARWLHELSGGEGNVLFVGGIPGNPASIALKDNIQAEFDNLGTGLTFLNEEPIDTNWDPAEEQRVMAGVLTTYDDIDYIVSDYGVASKGGIRAFLNAGRPLPPLATSASDNELGCLWQENKEANPEFELLSLDGTTWTVRIAARKALAALQGLPDSEPEAWPLIPFMDTVNGNEPPCEPDLPPDADLSSSLTVEQLSELFS
jgi:ribose transport system substrate-binding protein